MATKEILQQQFNKVFVHLMNQGEKSLSRYTSHLSENCAYRGENGLKCAAGCMIPEEKYTPDMEGLRWDLLCEDYPEAHNWLDRELGCRLQRIHDHYEPEYWLIRLEWLSIDFKFTLPTKDENGNWRTE